MIWRKRLINKLMVTYLAMIIPTLVAGSFAARQVWKNSSRQVQSRLDAIADQVASRIQNEFEKYNNLFSMALYDVRIIRMINGDDQFDPKMYLTPFLTLLNNLDAKLGSIRLYVAGDVPDNYYFSSADSVRYRRWYSLAITANDAIAYADRESLIIAEKIPELFVGLNSTVLTAEIKYSTLFYELEREQVDANVVIYDRRSDLVLYHQPFADTAMMSAATVRMLPFRNDSVVSDDSRRFLGAVRSIDEPPWTVASYLERTAVSAITSRILLVTALAALLSLSFALLMVFLLVRWIIWPIRRISEEMKKVRWADFSGNVGVTSDDEIGQLSRQYNLMTAELEKLMGRVYRSEIAQKEAKLRMLQAQVNPHFLYNCLSAINMEALRIDAGNIHRMVVSLATFYRTALNRGNELIQVCEEIENVRAYVNIQLLLNDNAFDVEYRIEEEASQCYVLNLLLQPLVENSIEHGIDGIDERGRITVSAFRQRDSVCLRVEDNGTGLASENESVDAIEGKGFGIHSVQSRIKLRFGDRYGTSYEHIRGRGTVATIVLPILTENPHRRSELG